MKSFTHPTARRVSFLYSFCFSQTEQHLQCVCVIESLQSVCGNRPYHLHHFEGEDRMKSDWFIAHRAPPLSVKCNQHPIREQLKMR